MPKMILSDVAMTPRLTPSRMPRLAARLGTAMSHWAAVGIRSEMKAPMGTRPSMTMTAETSRMAASGERARKVR